MIEHEYTLPMYTGVVKRVWKNPMFGLYGERRRKDVSSGHLRILMEKKSCF